MLRQQLAQLKAELEAAGRGLPSPSGLPDLPGSSGGGGGGGGGRRRR